MVVFTLIFALSNKEEYLYNVTLFYYLDRIHRKLTKSFLLAMVATAFLEPYVSVTLIGRKFYLTFLIVAYVAICIKMFLNRKMMILLTRKTMPRTAFVGSRGSFNKFKYFMSKTSIRIVDMGYIAMSREILEGAKEGDYIGCMEDLEELVRTYHLDQVYIIQKRTDELRILQQYVDLCISMGVTVRLIVDIYKRRRANSYVSTVGTYPIITYHTISLNTYEQIIKRACDIVGSLFGIIVLSPCMLVAAIAIKLDSKGPVLFKQTRVGQNGRPFKMYKFRSMYVDAEEQKKALMEQNEIQGGIMFKMKDDPRVTRVGKVIR
ncbi:MAG: sugar transferase, partial [Acetatifactor sp.]|nr:sugar transferase [Acetatifactor sp.]